MVQRTGVVRGIPTNNTVRTSYHDMAYAKQDVDLCKLEVYNQEFNRSYEREFSVGRAKRWEMFPTTSNNNSETDDDEEEIRQSSTEIKKQRMEQNRSEKKLISQIKRTKDKHIRREIALQQRQERVETDEKEIEEKSSDIPMHIGGLSDEYNLLSRKVSSSRHRKGRKQEVSVPQEQVNNLINVPDGDQVKRGFIVKTHNTREQVQSGIRNPIQNNKGDRYYMFENKKEKQKLAKDWKSTLEA